MDGERVSVLTPNQRAFYAPADPVVFQGPPLFDVTPISAPQGIFLHLLNGEQFSWTQNNAFPISSTVE